MKYKLIAIDMDGTLLNSSHDVSENNKIALKKAIDRGVGVIISTGRIFVSARYYANLLGIKTPIIACNGAYIKGNINKEEVLLHNPIKKDDLKKIIDVLEENNITYRYYDDKNFYTKSMDFMAQKYEMWNEIQEPKDRINIEMIKNPYDVLKRDVNVYKFVVIDEDNEKLNRVKEILKNDVEVEIVSSWLNSFDIMYKDTSKGKALKQLCEILNIDASQVIAIGDHENDLSMIKYAGTGVAMGNGEEIVKKEADIITDTNDNDGVCKIIEELILNQ